MIFAGVNGPTISTTIESGRMRNTASPPCRASLPRDMITAELLRPYIRRLSPMPPETLWAVREYLNERAHLLRIVEGFPLTTGQTNLGRQIRRWNRSPKS
jgi:hypothetical protein